MERNRNPKYSQRQESVSHNSIFPFGKHVRWHVYINSSISLTFPALFSVPKQQYSMVGEKYRVERRCVDVT